MQNHIPWPPPPSLQHPLIPHPATDVQHEDSDPADNVIVACYRRAEALRAEHAFQLRTGVNGGLVYPPQGIVEPYCSFHRAELRGEDGGGVGEEVGDAVGGKGGG